MCRIGVIIIAVSGLLAGIVGCVPLPIPHHVNSIRIDGTAVDVESGASLQNARVVLDCGKTKTFLTENDGTFSGTFGGQWRFVIWVPLLPFDVLPPPTHEESLAVRVSCDGFGTLIGRQLYRVEERRWTTPGGHMLRPSDRTKEMHLRVLPLKRISETLTE